MCPDVRLLLFDLFYLPFQVYAYTYLRRVQDCNRSHRVQVYSRQSERLSDAVGR